MRLLLLSDVHGNAVALDAVLRDARKRRWERALFLGDLVGYYTEPERSTRLLKELGPVASVLGNHDQVLLEMIAGDVDRVGEEDVVLEVLGRHSEVLSDESVKYIESFVPTAANGEWQAVHGGLRHPWEYIDALPNAQANIPLMERRICFVGHTHVPRLFATVEGPHGDLWRAVEFTQPKYIYRIPPRATIMFNPGSVGQPRDGSPLASYAIYDEELAVIEHYRVEFDLLSVQRSVREEGYPESLASRLAKGR